MRRDCRSCARPIIRSKLGSVRIVIVSSTSIFISRPTRVRRAGRSGCGHHRARVTCCPRIGGSINCAASNAERRLRLTSIWTQLVLISTRRTKATIALIFSALRRQVRQRSVAHARSVVVVPDRCAFRRWRQGPLPGWQGMCEVCRAPGCFEVAGRNSATI